jgi:hypothetical protein
MENQKSLNFWFCKPEPEPYTTINQEIIGFINKTYSCKKNFSKNKFLEKLSESLCTDWYKDYDNEFWTSSDFEIKDNAWNLTVEKCENEFIKLRNYYSDEIIFFAINMCCRLRYDNIESVTKMCKDILDYITLSHNAAKIIKKKWMYYTKNKKIG